MDLNQTESPSGLLTVSAGSISNIDGYHFQNFDDDVSKEGTPMAVDTVLSSAGDTPLTTQSPGLATTTFVHLLPPTSPATQEPSESQEKKKGGWPKGKKRKKTRDLNAPKQPLTGYVRFLNDRRDKVRSDNPALSFSEITKILGAEWSQLAQQEKQTFLDDAEKDKERYLKELQAYHQTEAYKLFLSKQQERKRKEMLDENETMETVPVNNSGLEMIGDGLKMDDESNTAAFDIPIFTEEFLDHNKMREAELRQLRRRNTEYEEQNAILGKHIDNMKAAIGKLEVASVQQRTSNQNLQQHLYILRSTLTANFGAIPLPDTHEMPTVDSIDNYMAKLHSLILDSPQENEALIANVREIVGRLNFEG